MRGLYVRAHHPLGERVEDVGSLGQVEQSHAVEGGVWPRSSPSGERIPEPSGDGRIFTVLHPFHRGQYVRTPPLGSGSGLGHRLARLTKHP
jgi:hypothetical protein